MSNITIFITVRPGDDAKRLEVQAMEVAGFDGSYAGEDEVGVTLRLLAPKLTMNSILKASQGIAGLVKLTAVFENAPIGSLNYLGNVADTEAVLEWLRELKKQGPRLRPIRVGEWFVMRSNERVFMCQYVRKHLGNIGALFDFYETTDLAQGQLPDLKQRAYRKQTFVPYIVKSGDWLPLGKRTVVLDSNCPKFLDSLKHKFRFPLEEIDDWHLVDDEGSVPISAADRPWERYEFHHYLLADSIRELLLTGSYQQQPATSIEEDRRTYEAIKGVMDDYGPGRKFDVTKEFTS